MLPVVASPTWMLAFLPGTPHGNSEKKMVMTMFTLLKTNMSPKRWTISIGNTSSNHWFSGDMLIFGGVLIVLKPAFLMNQNSSSTLFMTVFNPRNITTKKMRKNCFPQGVVVLDWWSWNCTRWRKQHLGGREKGGENRVANLVFLGDEILSSYIPGF